VGRWTIGGSATVDDPDVLKGVRSGDPAALEALMSQYSARVYRLAFGITRNGADAEEVVQDVFLTVLRKGATFVRGPLRARELDLPHHRQCRVEQAARQAW
jgi:hypothetical protein